MNGPMSDLERPIREEHENRLRRALNLEENADLPVAVKELYWDVERTARRMGVPIDGSELVLVVLLANRATPAEPVTFCDFVKAGQVKRDDIILVKFQNQWRFAKFMEVNEQEKKILAEMMDDLTEVRRFKYTSVRFPTAHELKTAGM